MNEAAAGQFAGGAIAGFVLYYVEHYWWVIAILLILKYWPQIKSHFMNETK